MKHVYLSQPATISEALQEIVGPAGFDVQGIICLVTRESFIAALATGTRLYEFEITLEELVEGQRHPDAFMLVLYRRIEHEVPGMAGRVGDVASAKDMALEAWIASAPTLIAQAQEEYIESLPDSAKRFALLELT